MEINSNNYKKYLDTSVSIDERVNDLLKRMTLEEKIREMGMYNMKKLVDSGKFSKELADEFFQGIGIGALEDPRLNPIENVEYVNEMQKYLIENTRLGIPALIVSECLHGFLSPQATMFPQAIALGSTWNEELIKEIASVIAKEAYSCGTRQGLAPNLDLGREPRWGRTEETYGEDSYLCSIMGVEYVKGLQGENTIVGEDKIVATLKHYAAHGSPEGGVNLSPVYVGERQLRDLYLPPFKKAIMEAGALSVMPAYSEIDGIPCSESKFLLTDILRNEWGFEGYTFSDYGGIEMLHDFQKTAPSMGYAGKQAVEAGMDLDAPYLVGFGDEFVEMVKSGIIDQKYIDQAVERILRVKFLAGIFEKPYADKEKAANIVNCENHRKLALLAAQESIILLKNANHTLPLNKNISSIAVIGPNADEVQFGGYSILKDNAVTVLQGIKNRVSKDTKVLYSKGCKLYGSSKDGFKDAVECAQKSEIAIVVVGTSSAILSGVGWGDDCGEKACCGEGYDTTDIGLPGVQEELIKEIAETGTPTVVVLINGRPLTIEQIHNKVDAILEAWYPGEEGGNAVADILFGNVNPSGKLTITFPKVTGQLPMFYNHKPSARGFYHKPGDFENPGRDYVFNDTKPLYEFGYGLSYTQFEYSELKVSPKLIKPGENVTVSVMVKNSGEIEGKEVVQLYLNDVFSSVTTPVKALKGFKKIKLLPGERKEVKFTLTAEEMSLINSEMKEVVEPGSFEVMISGLKSEFTVKVLE